MTENSDKSASNETNKTNDDSSATEAASFQEPQVPDSFSQLLENEQLLDSISKLGFTKPTPIQAQAIPFTLAGRDIIAQASTGSGKTAAFILPLISKIYTELKDSKPDNAFSLILAPTRELAVQIAEVAESLGDFKAPLLIGGSDMKAQERSLEKDCRIVVGTPGRVMDFIKQKILSLKSCRFFVLDEADEMLSMGFLQDVRFILSQLPDKRQGMFVSATITPRVDMLANSFLTNPEVVVAINPELEKQNIEHYYVEVKNDIMAKPSALSDIIESWRPRSAIIFCNTKSDTELVEVMLRKRGFDARRINSDLSQSQRNRIMKKIRSGDLQFLVATDIAARGLDIEQIDLVVNYAIHEQPETYVHRTGRTGRAGRFGKAISLVGAQDFGYFHHLRKMLDVKFEKIDVPADSEVIDARLAHLYEILRKENIALKDRDNLLAKTLLKELGNIEEPTAELLETTAKLCRFVIGHRLSETTAALEEEVSNDNAIDGEPSSGRKKHGDKRSRGKDDDFKKRGDKDSRGSERKGRDNDKRDNKKDSRRRDDDKKPDRRSDSRKDEKRFEDKDGNRKDKKRTPREPREKEFRIYIGQGTEQGMTEKTFIALASNMGEVQKEQLQNLSIRSDYGYVDIKGKDAQKLIANLNGIEYNGEVLPVKLATDLSQGERRRYDKQHDTN